MRCATSVLALVAALVSAQSRMAWAEAPAGQTKCQQLLSSAADARKYTFLVFYREDAPATRTMADTVKRGVEARSDSATALYVRVSDPAEQPLIEQFGVQRAPMPLCVAVAPEGAVTGVYPRAVTDEQLEKSFVSPGVARSMKVLQAGRMVFVCSSSTAESQLPPSIAKFQADPDFAGRSELIWIRSDDPAEAAYLRELKIDTRPGEPVSYALLAPPGVLVGTFDASTTKEDISAALHAAGKCCDDPNCKHHHHK